MKVIIKQMICLCILLCQGILYVSAQEGGVKFLENATFEQALKQAKDSGKMLFVDCYTSWCGPCKMMMRDVFPQPQVGNYFNPKFICAKFDMEKGEGKELHKRFQVKAYPTFLIIDAQTGNEITRIVGGGKADEFIKMVEESLSKGGIAALKKKYDAGDRSDELVTDYIKALGAAYMSKECAQVVAEYLKGKETSLLSDASLYKMFLENIHSPYNETFQYVWKHKNEFIQKYGREVEQMLNMSWNTYPTQNLLKRQDETITFDEKAMAEYVELMKKEKIENIDFIVLNTEINVAQAQGRWADMLKLAHSYDKKYQANDMEVYNWCLRLEQKCQDKALRADAASWIKERLAAIQKEIDAEKAQKKDPNAPAKAMSMVSGAGFKNAYEQLLAKLEK